MWNNGIHHFSLTKKTDMITSFATEQAFVIIHYLVMLEIHKLGKWERFCDWIKYIVQKT